MSEVLVLIKQKKISSIRIPVPAPKRKDPENYTLDEVTREYRDWLVRRLYNYGESNVESEDMAQDVLFRLFRYWPKAELTKIDALISRIAKNVVCDYLDVKYRRPTMIQFDPWLDEDEEGNLPDIGYIDQRALDPYRELLNDRDFEKVLHVYEIFTPVQKEVFDLHFGKALSPREVSDAMGVNLNVVYTALYAISRIVNDLCPQPETEVSLTWNMS